MFELKEQHLLSQKEISVKPSEIICYDDEERTVSSALMKQALAKGISVIAAGPYASFPVHLNEDILYMRFTSDILEQVIHPPWIKGLSPSAVDSIDNVLRTRMRSPSLSGKGIMMGDPTDRQCYYEVCLRPPRAHGRKNAELYPEALLSALLSQYMTHEGIRTMYLFLEVPYRPKSRECYENLVRAEDEGLDIVRICREGEDDSLSKDRYPIHSDGKGRLFTEKKKKKIYIKME